MNLQDATEHLENHRPHWQWEAELPNGQVSIFKKLYFHSSLMLRQNKLECLAMACF